MTESTFQLTTFADSLAQLALVMLPYLAILIAILLVVRVWRRVR